MQISDSEHARSAAQEANTTGDSEHAGQGAGVKITREQWADRMRTVLKGTLPGHLGVEVLDAAPGQGRGRLVLQPRHLHPGGYVHSAAIACLADSVAAWATVPLLGDGQGFSTIEFKCNFFAAVRSGVLVAEARALHTGRRTIVLESQVVDQEGGLVALMVVTQAVLERVAEGGGER